jgi:hypothetical protein
MFDPFPVNNLWGSVTILIQYKVETFFQNLFAKFGHLSFQLIERYCLKRYSATVTCQQHYEREVVVAINYIDLFTEDISQVVSAIVEIESLMVTLEARRVLMVASFDDNDAEELVPAIQQLFTQSQLTLNDLTNQFAQLILDRIQHRETVVEQLPGLTSEADVTQILLALIADMIENTQTVTDSVVTLGTITKTSVNTNAGDLILTQLHPGGTFNPGQGFIADRHIVGQTTQLALDDTITLTCNSGVGSGASEGGESFVVTGLVPKQENPFELNQGGNKGTTSLSVNDSAVVRPWTSFSNNIPSGWTVTSGAAGTDFGEEATIKPFDEPSLFFDNTAELRYDIYRSLEPGQVVYLYFYGQRVAGATGTVTVTLQINGVAFSTTAVDVTTMSSTSWTLSSVYFTVPDDIGDNDITLTYLSLSCTSLSARVYLANFNWLPFQYYAGVGMVITRGLESFLRDDEFQFTTANDDAGATQRVFTRAFGVQLPGSTGAGGGGGELIVNGEFATDTDWTHSNTSISGGVAFSDSDITINQITGSGSPDFSTGISYDLSVLINSVTGTLELRIGGTVEASYTTTGTKNLTVTPTSTGKISFYTAGGANGFQIDDVSAVLTPIP